MMVKKCVCRVPHNSILPNISNLGQGARLRFTHAVIEVRDFRAILHDCASVLEQCHDVFVLMLNSTICSLVSYLEGK